MVDLVQGRIDYYVDKNYLTWQNIHKYYLREGTLFLYIKILSMYDRVPFPAVTTFNIRKAELKELPPIFITDEGYKHFIKCLTNISDDLFKKVAPLHANYFMPYNFEYKGGGTRDNMLGLTGNAVKRTKREVTFFVLVDNSPPLDYLKSEYAFETNYEARTFINKLLRYVPPSKMEYYSVRQHNRGGVVRDKLPLIVTKAVYK